MKTRRDNRPDSTIPTSSMADVAFLLIIFFMICAVFATTKGLELKLPTEETSKNPDPDRSAVLIRVERTRVVVDCREMAPDEILAYLEPKLTRNPDKPVILCTDSDAAYENMVEVYDALAEAGGLDNPWPFEIGNLSVPTRREIDDYTRTFGVNPFEVACE